MQSLQKGIRNLLERYKPMKIATVILIISAFAAPVLLHAQDQSAAPSKTKGAVAWDKLSPLERYKQGAGSNIKSRKIQIEPVSQATGISTGLVVAYGHVIQSPYRVYLEGDRVLINGVQVVPSVIWERETKKAKSAMSSDKKQRYSRIQAIQKRVLEIYCDGKGKKANKVLAEEILASIRKETDFIEKASWQGDFPKGSLSVQYRGEDGADSIDLRETNCPSFWEKLSAKNQKKQTTDERHLEVLAGYVDGIKKGLEMGQVKFFASHGVSELERDCRDDVNKIMADKDASETQKAEALHQLGLDYAAALDVISNYSVDEWKVRK